VASAPRSLLLLVFGSVELFGPGSRGFLGAISQDPLAPRQKLPEYPDHARYGSTVGVSDAAGTRHVGQYRAVGYNSTVDLRGTVGLVYHNGASSPTARPYRRAPPDRRILRYPVRRAARKHCPYPEGDSYRKV